MRLTVSIALAVTFAVSCGRGCYASINDSVPALAKALSDLPPDSPVLDLAEGTYTIGSSWTISKPGITIRGAGIGKTVLIRDPQFDGIMVKVDAEKSTISNLTLDGKGTARVIFLNRPGDVADTIEVKNFTQIGVGVPALAFGCHISHCVVTGNQDLPLGSMAIWHDAGKQPLPRSDPLIIDHNEVTGSGIYCTGGPVKIEYNHLSRNHCVAGGGGGQMDIGNAFTTNTVATIANNTIVDGCNIKSGGIEMGGGTFTVENNTIRNHGTAGIGVGHNAVQAIIRANTISNSGRYLADKNKPQARAGIYVVYGAANVEISGNRCFDDQPSKTQTWGVILTSPPMRPDPRFAARATDHVVIKENDLRGNIHPEGLLDESRARDRIIAGNLPPQANRH
jgi:parallel beta helix pectate lyase-like protein